MASSRTKLSLRRHKKPSGASQARQDLQPLVADVPPPDPPLSGGVTTEGSGGRRDVISEPVCDSVSEEGDRGAEHSDTDDFRPLRKNGRKRKGAQNDPTSYVNMTGQEEMQLALALSASLQPQATVLDSPPVAKRGRRGNESVREASVIAASSSDSQRILAQRASSMLQELANRSTTQGPPPSLNPSRLAERGREAGTPPGDSSTLWEMAGYGEREKGSKFVVPALDLPTPVSKSHQHSPVAHSHISHSSHHSPVAHSHISPRSSPVAHSHISQSSQHSPVTHSHSSQHSPVTHSHSSQPSPVAHSRISHASHNSKSPHLSPQQHSSRSSHTSHPHSSPPPPPLPRHVQTLLSDLSSLVGSQLCSDVVITVADGRGIPAHSAILACRCPTLAERLFHNLDKPVHLDFSQFDRATVISFLHYLYTGAIPSQNGMKQVTMLAMSLGMMELFGEREDHHPLAHTQGGSGVRGEGGRGEGGAGVRGEIGAGVRDEIGGVVRGEIGDGDDRRRNQSLVRSQSVPSPPVTTSAVYAALLKMAMSTQGPTPHSTTHQATPTPSEDMTAHSSTHQATPTPIKDKNVRTSSLDVISVSSSPPSSPQPHQSPHSHSSNPHQSPPQTPSPQPSPPSQTPSPSLPLLSAQRDGGGGPSPSSEPSTELSPRPLLERISSSSAPPLPPESHDTSHDMSHEEFHEECLSRPQCPPIACSDAPASRGTVVVTPAPSGQKPVLESDTDITPLPTYQDMATPHLKEECSRFGVKALPKRRMIFKLEEIYNYTHPLTDADGNIVEVPATEATRKEASKGDGKKTAGRKKTEKPSIEELMEKVREVITKDTKLHEDVLMYKPLELSYIQSQLKAASLSLSRDTLMDVLDSLCITFSIPRQSQEQ